MKYDVVIAGGGPSGATCAEILAKNGINVILFEKGNRNRYKTCAGGLMWHNEQDFGPLPQKLVEREVEHLFLSGPTQSVDLKVANSSHLGQLTYRNNLDRYLRELAKKSGAIIETETEVTNVSTHKDYVEVEVKNNSNTKLVKADALVIAIGVQGTKLQRKLRMDRPADVEQAINAEFYLPSDLIEDRFGGGAYNLYFDSQIAPHGYLWIFTKKEGLSVGICDKIVNIDHFKNVIAHHPILSKKLEGAKPLEFDGKHISAAPIPDRIPEHIYRNRILLVGDAAGLSDRFTYEGIWHARLSGRLAGETLVKAQVRDDYSATFLQRYQRKCSRIFRTILNSQRMHHLIYHTGFMDLIIDTIVEVLQNKSLGEQVVSNIQILLEGFLEPGDKAASLSIIMQQKLMESLQKKVDRKIVRKINRELEFALAIN